MLSFCPARSTREMKIYHYYCVIFFNGVKDSLFHSINDFRCTGVSGNASSMSVYAALSFAL